MVPDGVQSILVKRSVESKYTRTLVPSVYFYNTIELLLRMGSWTYKASV